jgi:curved DNA-binding protein CbpA
MHGNHTGVVILKDYYEILEVHPKASQEIIKKAYQTLAKKYHPDVYGDLEIATKKMSLLNEAYSILSDEKKRKDYDSLLVNNNYQNVSYTSGTASYDNPSVKTASSPEEEQFLAASYLAYQNKEKPFKGRLILARLWGFGTTFLCEENFDYKSKSYITQYWITLLFFPVIPLNRYRIIKKDNKNFLIISKIPYNGNFINKMFSMYKRNKLGMIATLAIFLFISFDTYTHPTKTYTPPKQSINTTANIPSKYEPKKNVPSAYVQGAPILNDGGLGIVHLDNSHNDAPVYVRIWTNDNSPKPIRTFTVATHSKFTVNNMAHGSYTVRYKFLYETKEATSASKSEPFELTETETPQGTKYKEFTLTLYKVQNGNTRTQTISPNEI